MNITGFRYTIAPGERVRLQLYGQFSYQEATLFAKMMVTVLEPILKTGSALFSFTLEEYACSLKAEEEMPEAIARYRTSKNIKCDAAPTYTEMKDLIVRAEAMTRIKISEMKVQPGSPTTSTRGWSPMTGVGDNDGA